LNLGSGCTGWTGYAPLQVVNGPSCPPSGQKARIAGLNGYVVQWPQVIGATHRDECTTALTVGTDSRYWELFAGNAPRSVRDAFVRSFRPVR